MKITLTLPLLLTALLGACKSFDPVDQGDLGPESALVRGELGSTKNVTEWGSFTMGGQPTPADLELAAKRGVTRVINLRTEPEMAALDFDEAAVCRELGLEYVYEPLSWGVLTDEQFDRVLELMAQPTAGRTLFHCASGNRSSVFVAAYRMRTNGVPFDRALTDARTAGMKPMSKGVLEAQASRLGLVTVQ